jgi:TrmH RNA methyltransferase
MNERDRHREHSAPRPRAEPAQRRATELRVFGLNACLAVFARRPQAIRKIYLTQARLPALREVLSWCARERIGYRMVETADLEKLTRSEHHEGVCFEVLREPPLSLAAFLKAQRGDKPSWLVLLDGVGNPHNFGAVLRLAAHFGADAVLLPPGSSLALSGAACRVAEGGAEHVPLVALEDLGGALSALTRANYRAVATVVREGEDLYAAPLPRRAVFVFGAEGAGLSPALRSAVEHRVRIPGTGAIESLNIATAVAVVAAEFWRQYHPGAAR